LLRTSAVSAWTVYNFFLLWLEKGLAI
jgi:hypothetical protein